MPKATLRRQSSEDYYAAEKAAGRTNRLRDEPELQSHRYWAIIRARFPYDSVFQRHDLIIPKRDFALGTEMNAAEWRELQMLIQAQDFQVAYDLVFENTMPRRTEQALYHLHAAKYYATREEMSF